jgi:hypothetical protein
MRKMMRKQIRDINRNQLHYYSGYIAGLVDGEGSLMIHWNKGQPHFNFSCFMVIGMTHEGVIKWLAEILGVTYEKVKMTRKNWKQIYRVRLHTQDNMEKFLKELLPWLKVKKEQAEVILKFLNLEPEGNMRDYAKKRAELYLRIRELNKRGSRFSLEKEHNAIFERIETLHKKME